MDKKNVKAALREIRAFNQKKIREYRQNERKAIDPSEYICEISNPDNILEIDNLHTYFYTDIGTSRAVNGISLDIPRGKTVAIVGESGCGKSVTSLSIMRLINAPVGQIAAGAIRFNTGDQVIDLAKAPMDVVRKIRGNHIAMIFQEPMTSLNPVFTIGNQIDEIIFLHNINKSAAEVKARTIEMLNLVGISRVEEIYKSYPHQLSGGMRQRAMIAMSLACDPRLIIADEPTTALDVSIQAQILELLRSLKSKINGSIMLITHDLGVVAEMADYVVVMYSGRIVEAGTTEEIFHQPKHPYTLGLLKSKPILNRRVDELYSIPGQVSSPINLPDSCYFLPRCQYGCDKCEDVYPEFSQISQTHRVACHILDREGSYVTCSS